MHVLAQNIRNIIDDYRNDEHIQITTENVIEWVSQFEETDQEFILEELLHLLNQDIYLSKVKAKEFLHNNLQELARHFKYKKLSNFLANTKFLQIQTVEKSQSEIVSLMNEVLQEKYNFSITQCGSIGNKHFIYLDDVLATGSTFCRELENWLKTTNINNKKAIELFSNKQIDIIASFFCYHTWGWGNTQYILSKNLNSEKFLNGILLQFDYEIQNNIKFKSQKLNCIIPNEASIEAKNFLQNLQASSNNDRAYRNVKLPLKETFFSSPANRIRFENIILKEGIKIVNRIQNLKVPNIRPLGYTIKSHQTFGLGTMYFTWRNISNTCPLVFWWNNNGWKGLFPLKNRGLKK